MNPPVEFGVVFSSEDGFARMPEPYPKGLAFLAVPGGAFDSAELRMKLHRIASGKVAIVPRELVAYEIAALLPEQNTALRIEFARFFRARCKRALELRCSEVGLRFDWERMFREPAYRDALVLLLRGSFGRTFLTALRHRHDHPSPNSCYGMAGFAGALRIRLGGPTVYDGVSEPYPYWGDGRAELTPGDLCRAELLAVAATLFFTLILLAITEVLWIQS